MRFNLGKRSRNAWLHGLSIGGAASNGRRSDSLCCQSSGGLTESGRLFYLYALQGVSCGPNCSIGNVRSGAFLRTNAELTYLKGPFAARAEFDQLHRLVIGQQSIFTCNPAGCIRTDNTIRLPGLVGKGFSFQTTYLLTRETKPENGIVVPRHSVGEEGAQRAWGAWELKFRYSFLDISDKTAFSNQANTYYFGVNWYVNRYVKFMSDFGVERTANFDFTVKPPFSTSFAAMQQLQFSF